MATIAPTTDGAGGKSITTTASDNTDSFVACRSSTSGQYNYGSSTAVFSAASARAYTYGGTNRQMWLTRAFFNFDTSAISAPPSAASLVVYGYSGWNDDIIAVKHNNTGTINGANWDLIDGCTSQIAASDGVGTGTFASCATNYSSEFVAASGNTNQYNTTAIGDIVSEDTFRIALVQYDNDYLDITCYPSNSSRVGMYFQEDTDGGRDPYLDYTPGTIDDVVFTTLKANNSDIDVKNANLTIKP